MFLSALGIAIKEKEPIRDPLVTGVGHQNLIDEQNQAVAFGMTNTRKVDPFRKIRLMMAVAFAVLAYIRVFLVSRHRLALEVVALRQQLAVWKRKQPRPKLQRLDRLFWITLCQLWTDWRKALLIVKPETVVSWHRAGFRLFWRWRSRSRSCGRPRVEEEIWLLIRSMRKENPSWGAPRIHGELLQLGFEISEPTVSRYLRSLKRVLNSGKAKQWLAFLNNHREVIAAFDFFAVPSAAFHTWYCFFVIEHSRRRILHFNVTRHPTSEWIVQQLRESFPLPSQYRYVLFDHDAKFGGDVLRFLKSSDLIPIQTSIRSPWQNGIAERFVGSIRRELLDHVIPLNEFHLRRLGRDYLAYYHKDRTHIGLDKNTPSSRVVEPRCHEPAQIVAEPRVGGLHHRYIWSAVA